MNVFKNALSIPIGFQLVWSLFAPCLKSYRTLNAVFETTHSLNPMAANVPSPTPLGDSLVRSCFKQAKYVKHDNKRLGCGCFVTVVTLYTKTFFERKQPEIRVELDKCRYHTRQIVIGDGCVLIGRPSDSKTPAGDELVISLIESNDYFSHETKSLGCGCSITAVTLATNATRIMSDEQSETSQKFDLCESHLNLNRHP